MPHVLIEITKEQQEQFTAVSKSTGFTKDHLKTKWFSGELKKAFAKTPQSVLDNLASDKNE